MKKLKWYEILLIKPKRNLASIGWKMFIYFNNFTEEEYWNKIYEQEIQHRNTQHKNELKLKL